MTNQICQHIAVISYPAIGHFRPLMVFLAKLLSMRPELFVTIVNHPLVVPKMQSELQRTGAPIDRINIIPAGDPIEPTSISEVVGVATAGLIGAVPDILRDIVNLAMPQGKPGMYILDLFCAPFLLGPVSDVAGPGVPVLAWWPEIGVNFTFLHGPQELGGMAHLYSAAHAIFNDEDRRAGRSLSEICNALFTAQNETGVAVGRVVRIPGAEPLFDYELNPQAFPADTLPWDMLFEILLVPQRVDGMIIPTSACYQAAAFKGIEEWYGAGGLNKRMFAVGVQLPEEVWGGHELDEGRVGSPYKGATTDNEKVGVFLDDSMEKHGRHSVLLISFGTLYYPMHAFSYIVALLETLLSLEQPFPFIFCLGGITSSLPDELREKVLASGRGLITRGWVEQQRVLAHPAMGWFLNHAGYSSVFESIVFGVPMIMWPCLGEQPLNAHVFSQGEDAVGFELLQVRTGPAQRPPYRGEGSITIAGTDEAAAVEMRDVFARARGPEGDKLRANAQTLAVKLREDKEKGSRARIEEMLQLLD